MRAMMLVLSLLLGIIPLLGVVWILMSGMITLWPFSATVDGLFMSLILLALAGCFFLNVYWEMNDAGMLSFVHKKKETAVPAPPKAPAPKAS